MTTVRSEGSWTLDRVDSPPGTILVVTDAEGRLRALDWEDCEDRMQRLLRLHYRRRSAGQGVDVVAGKAPRAVGLGLASYLAGDLAAVDRIAVETGGTPFQRAVWAALRAIPAGTTTSYGAIARKLGRPLAARAVGFATGSNPISIVVPCHRVVGADSSLTGYAGGVARKRWLLAHEGATP